MRSINDREQPLFTELGGFIFPSVTMGAISTFEIITVIQMIRLFRA